MRGQRSAATGELLSVVTVGQYLRGIAAALSRFYGIELLATRRRFDTIMKDIFATVAPRRKRRGVCRRATSDEQRVCWRDPRTWETTGRRQSVGRCDGGARLPPPRRRDPPHPSLRHRNITERRGPRPRPHIVASAVSHISPLSFYRVTVFSALVRRCLHRRTAHCIRTGLASG